jgi:hypothetical protein
VSASISPGGVTKNWILDLQSRKINMELLCVRERKTKNSFAGYNSTPISCASGSSYVCGVVINNLDSTPMQSLSYNLACF